MQPMPGQADAVEFIDRVCPGCGSSRAVPAVAAPKPSEKLGMDELLYYWGHFFKEKSFFTYHRCQDCHLLYAPRFLSLRALGELYSSGPDNTAGQPRELMEATQLGYFRPAASQIPNQGSFLEIGPDIGLFARICADHRAFDQYWFFEPNQAVHDDLAARMADRPHRILTSMDDLSPVPSGTVGLAAMIHVLDHLLDPVPFLRSLHRCMAPEGRLLIVTHNEGSLLARVLGTRWAPYCLQHPQLFRPSTIGGTLRNAGFRVIQVHRTVNHFPVTYLAQHLAFNLGMGKLNLPAWPSLAVGVKLGNILTVAEPF